jgi:broad specificity phosphatase PhoE
MSRGTTILLVRHGETEPMCEPPCKILDLTDNQMEIAVICSLVFSSKKGLAAPRR